MRGTMHAGLGLALMGGLLAVGCGDSESGFSPIEHAPDFPPGGGGKAGQAPAPGGAPGTGGVAGAAGRGTPGTGGAHPPRVSPPPPQGSARLLAPLSGSLLSTNRPTFHWQPGAGADGATVELCADRACTTIVTQIPATGSSATAPASLAAGHVFWRVRGTTGGQPAGAPSATWEAFIPHRTATPSSALATRPDFDGDGFGDFALDDRVILGGPTGYARSFPLPHPTPAADISFFVMAGDINGDGFGDILRLDGNDDLSTMGISRRRRSSVGRPGSRRGPR